MTDDDSSTRDAVTRALDEDVGTLLGLEAGAPIDRRRRLDTMGLDSLMAMDLLALLEGRYGSLPQDLIRDNPTIQLLTDALVARLATTRGS